MRDIIRQLLHAQMAVDFEKAVLQASVPAAAGLWQEGRKVVGFAFVDDWNKMHGRSNSMI